MIVSSLHARGKEAQTQEGLAAQTARVEQAEAELEEEGVLEEVVGMHMLPINGV